MGNKYQIECTEEELCIIRQCVEVCHRISCGQMESLNDIIPNRIDNEELYKVKAQAFPELSKWQSYSWCGGYGSLHGQEDNRSAKAFSHFQAITYPIYREILHYLAKKDGVDNVYSSETLNAGEGGFIKIKAM